MQTLDPSRWSREQEELHANSRPLSVESRTRVTHANSRPLSVENISTDFRIIRIYPAELSSRICSQYEEKHTQKVISLTNDKTNKRS